MRGKTIVMLVNDPPVPDPSDPTKLDDRVFKGKAMTYYGRWTYKYEIAAEKGAAAALVVHETGPAGYPWAVVVGSNTRELFELPTPGQKSGHASIEGWITRDQAAKLFGAGGFDFETLKRAAVSRDFKPVRLGITASFTVQNALREVHSQNVIARLEGADPKLKDQDVIYTAHWDHLGRDPNLSGNQIYHGALDNASGTATVLELAHAFKNLKHPPKRSLLFLIVTAEEKGLLGSEYYATHPLYPLERTLANLNIDGVNPWGRTRDLEVIGNGNSTLEDVLAKAVAGQGRLVTADSQSEKGYFYRSDHFEFAKVGVPALYIKGGMDYRGQPKDYGHQKHDAYTTSDYHKVTDEIKPDWDLSGAVEDTQLLFEVGWTVAQQSSWPTWKPGSEFLARRQQMLGGASRK